MISSLLALSSSLLLAVASPLQTADDYVFTRPAISNAIKGVVMGETGDYGTMRYEDLAFLNEAFAELDFLRWNQSSSNDFIRAVNLNRSNSIPKSVEIKEEFRLVPPASYYLANDDEISTQPRLVTIGKAERFAFSLSTNRYELEKNTIEQAMTNGTVDVWTNSWHNPIYKSNTVVRTSSTNTLSQEDFCMNDHVIELSQLEKSYLAEDLKGTYSKRAITNLYALAKKMRHSVPQYCFDPVPAPANSTYNDHDEFHDDPDVTVFVTSTVYSVRTSRVRNYSDTFYLVVDEWIRLFPIVDDDKTHRTSTYPNNLNVKIVSDINDLYADYGTDDPRIKTAQAFAIVTTDYFMYKSASATGHDDVESSTNMSSKVMIPLGKCERTSPINERLTFEISIPLTIYKTAAEFSEIPFLENEHVPDLIPGMTPSWISTPSLRYQSLWKTSEERINSNLTIYLILELNPKTKLSN